MMTVACEELGYTTVAVDVARVVAPTAAYTEKKWWWVGVETVDDVCLIWVCSVAAVSAGVDNFVPQKLVVELQDNYFEWYYSWTIKMFICKNLMF